MGLSSSTSFFPVVASTARAAEEVTLLVSIALAPLLSIANSTPAFAQSPDPPIELTVSTGRPLEVVLDQRITVKAVGQAVTGTLVEPLYAYDRIVVPSGTRVLGHISALEGPTAFARSRSILSGDLTPRRHVVLQFDSLVLAEHSVPIQTVVKTEIPHLKRTAAAASEGDQKDGVIGHMEHEAKARVTETISAVKQSGRDVLAEITQPGKAERLKHELVQRLPYHPQYIEAGTAYHVELLAPIDFGHGVPSEAAPASARPAPSSILHARLITTLDSSKTPRGTPIQAMVTEPVFSAEHQLIFPEGTVLSGEVTYATPAKSLHRNGHLRFLFESVQTPATDPVPLLASLHSVQASEDSHVAIDEEGGATLTNPKTRFIAPTLAILALRGNLSQHDHLDPDGDGHVIHEGAPGAQSVGGFIGFGLMGIPLSFMAKPLGIAFSAIGAVRTTYSNVLGKGQEVQFPTDTVIQLQLAPGPPAGR